MKHNEFDMEIDIFHALEDFLDSYDNHAEMVVTEAIANAIDVRANKVRVELVDDSNIGMHVLFFNNGPSMNRQEFNNYHVISRSSKSKGHGIGFAGIGAKVYLAAWHDTVIHTETTNGNTRYASDMYVRDKVLRAKYIQPTIREKGTLYRVKLKPEDYRYLENNLEDLIVKVFDPALLNGLEIVVNGKRIEPWNPDYEFKRRYKVTIRDKSYQLRLIVTKNDIPTRKTSVQYHVSGKIISTKKPEWVYDVQPAYQGKVHVYVDAIGLSNMLNLNKTGFKQGSGMVVSQVFKEIDRKVFNILKTKGYTGDKVPNKWEHTRLTKFFEKLFEDPKYAFLNPDARGGRGIGAGKGSGEAGTRPGDVMTPLPVTQGTDKPDKTEMGDAEKKNQNHRRGGKFSIGWVQRHNDKRDGWLDHGTNKLIINIEHPLFIKYEDSVIARNQRVGVILTSVLIKNSALKKDMTVAEAFELQGELLTLARDAMW